MDNDQGWYSESEYLGNFDPGEIKRAEIRFKNEICSSESFSIKIVAPIISIESIYGNLFYVNAVIANVGDGIATDVNWNILLNSGYFFSGKNTSDIIEFIEPGGHITVTSDFIFGMSGRTIITASANIEGQNKVNKEVESSIFLFFIKIKT